ncbi:MAG: sigma-70 family RNA polymerase sigma factor [Erysipelotrichaceae bacterium]|nr:sigma-70 family RNA polymerase sigma factor [Erysipelotrichaceae bacterium]MBQ7890403.1 sigma-70 family RNA polymerase sigma factor [Erysipelotrichaceae bacterium]
MDEIMRTYANDVKRFCMSLCHDEQMAEELTQETFYRALKTIHHYDGSCLMTTWLFTIAKRVWIDTLRKKKTVSLDEIAEDQFRTDETPEVLFDRKQRMELLMTIIDEIKEPEKSVFLMRAVLDHSYKEIGKALGKSENWTRVTYYRVRMKLMERVKQYEDTL